MAQTVSAGRTVSQAQALSSSSLAACAKEGPSSPACGFGQGSWRYCDTLVTQDRLALSNAESKYLSAIEALAGATSPLTPKSALDQALIVGGVVLGAVALAAGGAGLYAGIAGSVGVALAAGGASVFAGGGAVYLDARNCNPHNQLACLGAVMGGAAAVEGLAAREDAIAAGLGMISAGSAATALSVLGLQGLSLGVIGLLIREANATLYNK